MGQVKTVKNRLNPSIIKYSIKIEIVRISLTIISCICPLTESYSSPVHCPRTLRQSLIQRLTRTRLASWRKNMCWSLIAKVSALYFLSFVLLQIQNIDSFRRGGSHNSLSDLSFFSYYTKSFLGQRMNWTRKHSLGHKYIFIMDTPKWDKHCRFT